MTSTTVTNDFTYILARSPIGSEGQAYDSLLTNGVYNATTLATALAGSTETLNYVDPIVLLYESSFGKAPDNAGLQFWVGLFEQTALGGASKVTANALAAAVTAANGATTAQVAAYNNALVEVSNSFVQVLIQNNFGGVTPTNTQFVQYLYQNLLGHAADASGLTYWVNALSTQSMGEVLANFVAVANTQSANTSAIQSWQINAGLTGNPATNIPLGGSTYTLTTGQDTITGGANNTVIGTDATVSALDSVAFTGAGNVMNLSDVTGHTLNLANFSSVSGVQTLNLTEVDYLKGNALNLTSWTGLTAANVTELSASAAATTAITVADTTALNLTETVTTAHSITTTGGSTVAITAINGSTDNHASAITVNGGAATTAVSVTQSFSGTSPLDAAVTVQDANYTGATALGTITAVTINGDDGAAVDIKDSALANLTVSNVAAASTVTIDTNGYASASTTLNLSLNNDKALTVADTHNEVTALNITTGATASTVAALTGFSGVTALTVAGSSVLTITDATGLANDATIAVSGAAGLKADVSGLANLTSITSSSSGAVTLTLSSTESFTSTGSGKDVITITDVVGANQSIAAGTNAGNEIVWDNAGTTTVTSFGTVSGFTQLGLGANVASAGNVAFDFSKLAGYTSIDVMGGGADAITLSNVTQGTSLSIDTGIGGVVYQTADTAGPSDSVSVTLGATGAAGITVGALTLEDASFQGIGTVTLTSNSNAAASANVVTAFQDANLSVLNVAGTSGVELATFNDSAATLTINGTAATGSVITLDSVTDSSLTSLTITGTDAVTVTALTASSSSLTVNDSSSAAVAITTLNDTAGTVTFNNTGTGTDATLTVTNAWTDNSLTALNLNGSVALSLADSTTSAITVAGSADNADVSLAFSGASTKAATIGLGNGDDTVSIANTTGTVGITVGTGTDSVTVGTTTGSATIVAGSASSTHVDTINAILLTTGTVSITTGGGADVISVGGAGTLAGATITINSGAGNDSVTVAGLGTATITAGAGNDTITAGNGTNTITAGAGNDTITVGTGANSITVAAHTSTAATHDSFVVGANASLSSFTTITGAALNDTVTISDATAFDATAITAAQVTAAGGDSTTLAGWVAGALSAAGAATAQNHATWFTFQNNTYIVEQSAVGNAAFGAGDTIIKLTGIHDLSGATIAGHVITL